MELSEDIIMIRDAVAEFASGELEPTAEKIDQAATLERDRLVQVAELGLFGVTLPEEAGGIGMGAVALSLVLEELAARCPSTALAVAAHGVWAVESIHRLVAADSPIGRDALLEAMVGGETIGTVAWGPGVEATGSGDAVTLKGTASLVPVATVADRVIVEAATGEGATGLYLVETGAGGVTIDAGPTPLGMRAAGLADVVLDGANATPLAASGADAIRDLGRLAVAAIAVGTARGASTCGVGYAKERHQFERPIASFGGIRIHLARMAVGLESSRRLVLHAASLLDAGASATLEVSIAKFAAGEAAVEVADRAVQVHGGYGYTADYAPERFYRNAQVLRVLMGTDSAETARIADCVLA